MILLTDEETKKIYEEDNKLYTMLDMGNYVGHRFREWYEPAEEVWKLMFFDEKSNDGQTKHIEALVDEFGNYMRIIADINNDRRVIQIDNGFVYNDCVIENAKGKEQLGTNYSALDGNIYSDGKIRLEKYLAFKQEFKAGDKIYTGKAIDNDLIQEFLTKSKELIGIISEEKTTKKDVRR